MLTTLLVLSLASYIFLGLLLRGSIHSIPKINPKWLPTVSIIVAAKNEKDCLADCLTSLTQLDYPSSKLEIVVVDDASTDGTGRIMDSFANEACFHVIKLKDGEKRKPGKAGALLVGIDNSRGDIVFITDADCIVPSTWVRATLAGFRDRTGVVGGYTLLTPPKTLFEKLQSLDWRYLLSIASAASQLNKPITWVGNNLAVRRAAYDAVGGYEQLDESFVEDFALINAIEKDTDWQCRFFASPDSTVRTHAAATWRELYQQRKRWGMGISSARPFGLWIMLSGFLTHFFILISIFVSEPLALTALALKLLIDLLIFLQNAESLHEPFRLPDLLYYEIYYFMYTMLLPLLMLFDRRITWKGATLPRERA